MPSCSFSEALEVRYVDDCDDSNPVEPCKIFLVGSFPGRSSPSGRPVLPRILTLNCCGIDRAGELQKIDELCCHVEELHLAQNELSDLNEIDSILQHMPSLTFLNLSHNVLQETSAGPLAQQENMRSLVLNHTRVPWTLVASFLRAMPNIQELHISLNEYTSVDLPSNMQHPKLKQLFLCGNPISSWTDITRIGKLFPNLESLIMSNSRLSGIPEPDSWAHFFPRLQTINFNGALFGDWGDIDQLNHFQKLEDLRLVGIPIMDALTDLQRRQYIIARLPRMVRLNGSEIMIKEKEAAERAFIRHYLGKDHKPKRFYELEAIHGKLDPLVEVDLSPKMTAEVLINFCEEQQPLTINLRNSVQQLKALLSKKYGLRPTRMRLFYIDQEMKEFSGPDELRYNKRKLHNYMIKDGDEFLVDSK